MSEQTLNPEASSAPAPQPAHVSEDLISTVELSQTMNADTPPDGGAKPGDPEKATATTEETTTDKGKPAEEDKAKPEGDSDRFDKHPRFQELHTRVKTAEETNRRNDETIRRLEQKLADLESSKAKPDGNKPDYLDFSKMTADELLDLQSEKPHEFLSNLNKMIGHQIQTAVDGALKTKTEADERQSMESKVESTYRAYAEKNPDFDQMWDSGDIKRYMDANPGHNAISAHMALTAENRQKAAIDTAVKEALAKADAERRTTRKAAAIIPAGPGQSHGTPASNDAELKNPKQFGGDTAVLTRRLEQMRAASGT